MKINVLTLLSMAVIICSIYLGAIAYRANKTYIKEQEQSAVIVLYLPDGKTKTFVTKGAVTSFSGGHSFLDNECNCLTTISGTVIIQKTNK